jgi:hypothetical protein
MAASEQVKRYLACWFQLGKQVRIQNGQKLTHPQTVLAGGDHYTPEFESYWQQMQTVNHQDCYLEGTDQTLADLLSDAWEISDCARCAMPVPIRDLGISDSACPCHDLSAWPNTDLPTPRSPINNQQHLGRIYQAVRSESLQAAPGCE